MDNQHSEQDLVGETAYPAWGTVTPVARASIDTFRWKNFAFFRTRVSPLQVEVVANGRREVVEVPFVEANIVWVLSLVFGVVTLVVMWLRR